MPTGAEGVAIKDKAFKHTVAVDLNGVRKNLTKYLDDYAAKSPFPKPDRPMTMKAVKVIALVQNESTKEIVQACRLRWKAGAPAASEGEPVVTLTPFQ